MRGTPIRNPSELTLNLEAEMAGVRTATGLGRGLGMGLGRGLRNLRATRSCCCSSSCPSSVTMTGTQGSSGRGHVSDTLRTLRSSVTVGDAVASASTHSS